MSLPWSGESLGVLGQLLRPEVLLADGATLGDTAAKQTLASECWSLPGGLVGGGSECGSEARAPAAQAGIGRCLLGCWPLRGKWGLLPGWAVLLIPQPVTCLCPGRGLRVALMPGLGTEAE